MSLGGKSHLKIMLVRARATPVQTIDNCQITVKNKYRIIDVIFFSDKGTYLFVCLSLQICEWLIELHHLSIAEENVYCIKFNKDLHYGITEF